MGAGIRAGCDRWTGTVSDTRWEREKNGRKDDGEGKKKERWRLVFQKAEEKVEEGGSGEQ